MTMILQVNITMTKIKVAGSWSKEWLEVHGPQPLSDRKMQELSQRVLNGEVDKNISLEMFDEFKQNVEDWIVNSKLNSIRGFDSFKRRDVMTGCTQFIDNLYMKSPVQVIRGDYKYHERLAHNTEFISNVDYLRYKKPLIIAFPFPSTGSPLSMNTILSKCLVEQIPVHLDGAWITCARDLNIDLSHPAIKSVGISLSKGLGLGWNRIGVRWHKDEHPVDSISIMNDHHMLNSAMVMIGNFYLKNLPPDYLWDTYGNNNKKICDEFGLTQTHSIHIALTKSLQPVGLTPLMRYLENDA